MASQAEVVETLMWQVEEVSTLAMEQARQATSVRTALRDLAEGVEVLRASFRPGTRAARVVTGALAGRYEAARSILGE